MVVNNNAAAVLLALSSLSKDREAIVSRGQLVEIGGSFRIPEVMALSGAQLREVGATNKTHLRDYEAAVNEHTGLLVKVHTSNFRVLGFTESPSTEDLVRLGHQYRIPVMEDLGSGSLLAIELDGYREPTVAEVVRAGVDVVTFSGDKLLGGPQAGLVVGRRELIAQMKKNPLARAVRVDKMTLAALEMVLRRYLEGRGDELPLWQMLRLPLPVLHRRATNLARRLQRTVGMLLTVSVTPDFSEVGGGSMPGTRIPTWVVTLVPQEPGTVAELERALRQATIPVVARIHQNALVLDVRTVLTSQMNDLVAAIAESLARYAR